MFINNSFQSIKQGRFRNEINDQWHKVGKSLKKETKGTQEVAKPLDSLVIIEPYDDEDEFYYQKLANEYQQVIFLPKDNGIVTVMPDGNGVSKRKKTI